MLRCGAAAAAHDGCSGLGDLGQLLSEIVRRPLEHRPAAQHRWIPRVGHHREGDAAQIQRPDVFQHMVGAGYTVETHRIHLRQRGSAAEKRPAGEALTGGPIKGHGKGDDQKGLRTAGLQMTGQFSNSLVGGEGLRQKMGNTPRQKEIGLPAVILSPAQFSALRCGTDIREHIGVAAVCGLQRQTAACLNEPAGQFLPALGQIHSHSEGVGLDCPAAGFQISPVNACNLPRVEEIGQLTALLRPAGQSGKASAHGTVKQQRAVFLQINTNVCHPNTFLAISTDWRASFA